MAPLVTRIRLWRCDRYCRVSRNLRKKFDGMIFDAVSEAVDLSMQLWSDGHGAQAFKRFDQRVGEAVQPVAVSHDAFAFHVVEHFAHLLGGKFVVIQK